MDACLILPVSFRRRAETDAERHARRGAEAFERTAEIDDLALELGVERVDLLRRLATDTRKVVEFKAPALRRFLAWCPGEARLVTWVDGVRLPDAHVLDVEGFVEQARAVLRTGALDFTRARAYGPTTALCYRVGDEAVVRVPKRDGMRRQLDGLLPWDEARRAFIGEPSRVWSVLQRVFVGHKGVSPQRTFDITPS